MQCSSHMLPQPYFHRQAAFAPVQGAETPFRNALLQALLAALPETPDAVSSGAIFWLFKLLNGFAAHADATSTSSVCLELLTSLSEQLTSLTLREHHLLRARYVVWETRCSFKAGVECEITCSYSTTPRGLSSSRSWGVG